mmetsp:Transcript_24347/g.49310  ORF Transcript_24347/g.49310 Transcript_24347/m.49310 type:complete len:200 (-) Transcript_24347:161-760(-)
MPLGHILKLATILAYANLTWALTSCSFASLPSATRRNAFVRAGTTVNPRDVATKLGMCICIDCKHVTNCAAYHFVETKHEQPHMAENPTFEPRDGSPTIEATFRTVGDDDQESEFERMMREHKIEEAKAVERAQAMGHEVNDPENSDVALYGEEKYDLSPVTTVEYDVVACEDFILDKGCWVRNMPEEIKKANPSFVPT